VLRVSCCLSCLSDEVRVEGFFDLPEIRIGLGAGAGAGAGAGIHHILLKMYSLLVQTKESFPQRGVLIKRPKVLRSLLYTCSSVL
jgi:hypothetical protein